MISRELGIYGMNGRIKVVTVTYEIQSPTTRLGNSPGSASFDLGLVMGPSYYAQGPCLHVVDDEDEVRDNSRTSCWRATEHVQPAARPSR